MLSVACEEGLRHHTSSGILCDRGEIFSSFAFFFSPVRRLFFASQRDGFSAERPLLVLVLLRRAGSKGTKGR